MREEAVKLIRFYFSDSNLLKDRFLKSIITKSAEGMNFILFRSLLSYHA